MPSPEEQKAELPMQEEDHLFDIIVPLVLEEDLSLREKEETIRSISMMLAIFRQRLYGGLCGGLIKDGKAWEDRLERQVSIYPRIPNSKKPEVVDLLRAVVQEKIEFDRNNKK